MSEISSSLYWTLPTPADFIHKVTDAARSARSIILSFPEYMPVDPIHAMERGLKNANIHEPLILNIRDGMNISVEIGTHFGGGNVPAEVLAHYEYGAQHAVVLQPHGKRAQSHCEKYTEEFIKAIDESVGDVRLVMAIRNGLYMEDASSDKLKVIAFDGGLKYAEMDAYVAMRMVNYPGPGSTNLYKHLVTEYGSFDPAIAEKLSRMETSMLLGLPLSLTDILREDLIRWSKLSWVMGTKSNASVEIHPLHECYSATHSGSDGERYKRLSGQRYWRACLKSIIPWLEERRPRIIQILDRPLQRIESAAGGHDKIQKKMGQQMVNVTRDELEYNDIFYQSHRYEFNDIPFSQLEHNAVGICRLAKAVRDDLSHLRPPSVDNLTNLISSMDLLIPG